MTLEAFFPVASPNISLQAQRCTFAEQQPAQGREDDGHPVVDRHSKVWRVEDLFVGGCGVIPTQNACNPTLTAACFAIVGARKIVEAIYELKANGAK